MPRRIDTSNAALANHTMGLTGIPVDAQAFLASLDPIPREQYVDFDRAALALAVTQFALISIRRARRTS